MTTSGLEGRVALVTGGTRGLGAGIVRALAGAGATVAVIARTDAASLPEGCSLIVKADVTDAQAVDAAVAQVEAALGGVDILVANAGIYPVAGLLDLTPDAWDETLAVNLRGPFLCLQRVARAMVARGTGGSIVLIGSTEAVTPAPGHAHYAASKAGLVQLGKAAALELGVHGIRVNTVSPGLVNRPSLAADWPEGLTRFSARAPLGRPGEPVEIGEACVFLAGDDARWITGAHLVVDGGVLVAPAF